MTLAIGHGDGKGAILDHLDEVQGRLNPLVIVRRFADEFNRYQVFEVFGEVYSAQWAVSAFREYMIEYWRLTRLDSEGRLKKSQLLFEFLPLVNDRQVTLLRSERLERQLTLLERSPTRGGRDGIDHLRGTHDDLANAAAGAHNFTGLIKNQPVEIIRSSGSGRALLQGKIAHIPDIASNPDHKHPGKHINREIDCDDVLKKNTVPVLMTQGEEDTAILLPMEKHIVATRPIVTASWFPILAMPRSELSEFRAGIVQ